MKKFLCCFSVGILASALLSFGTASAHYDPASGHFYCDDTSQNANCGFNKTTGWRTASNSNAAGGSYSWTMLSSSTLSSYDVANWYIKTNDRVGTGNFYGWDVYIPSNTGTLHDTARYFKDGEHISTLNQNSYKGMWVTVAGTVWMSDNTQYRFSVDNYRPAYDSRDVVADAVHFYD